MAGLGLGDGDAGQEVVVVHGEEEAAPPALLPHPDLGLQLRAAVEADRGQGGQRGCAV